MMAATGQRDREGFFGRLRSNFDALKQKERRQMLPFFIS